MGKKPFPVQKKHVVMFLLLLIFWLILASRVTVETLLLGTAASAGIIYYTKDMIFKAGEGGPITPYYLWNYTTLISTLLVEIVKSNIHVAKIVLDPKLPIHPTFVRVPVRLKKDFHKVLYGNAVTLTPGTLTVDIVGDEYIIHALTDEAAEDLKHSSIEAHVLRLEEER